MKKLLLNLLCLSIVIIGRSQPNDLNQKVKQSIKKSAAYFSAMGTDIGRNDVVMMLFLLQEHFNYPLNLPPLSKFKEQDSTLNQSYFMLYNNYFDGRNTPMYPDSAVIKFLKENMYTIDGMSVWAMFCNKFPLPDDMLKILNGNAELGDYDMTHTALHLTNMLQLECLKPNAETEKLKEKLAKVMTAEINSDAVFRYSDDLKYECMAMLYYLGKGNLVTENNIKYIIEKQLSNGGWSSSIKENSEDNIHTSLLAFWTLLEYRSRNP